MKTLKNWALGAALALGITACTGSSEPPAPSLFVAAGGQELRFYNATDVSAVGGTTPTPITTWNVGANILDIFLENRANIRRIWVLTPGALLRYDIGVFREDPANIGQILPPGPGQNPPPPENLTSGLNPAFSCQDNQINPSSYLRSTGSRLLVVCGQPQGIPLIWRPSLDEAALTSTNQVNPSVINTPSPDQTLFALFGEGLAYVFPSGVGFILRYNADPTSSTPPLTLEQSFSVNSLIDPQLQDFTLPQGQSQLYLVLQNGIGTDSAVVTWNPTSQTPTPSQPRDFRDRALNSITAGQGILVAFGARGFVRLDQTGLVPATNPNQSFEAGVVGLDGFLYLSTPGGNAGLFVYDPQSDPTLSNVVASKNLGFDVLELAYGPVATAIP